MPIKFWLTDPKAWITALGIFFIIGLVYLADQQGKAERIKEEREVQEYWLNQPIASIAQLEKYDGYKIRNLSKLSDGAVILFMSKWDRKNQTLLRVDQNFIDYYYLHYSKEDGFVEFKIDDFKQWMKNRKPL